MFVMGLLLVGTVGALLWLPPIAGFASSAMMAGAWCRALEAISAHVS